MTVKGEGGNYCFKEKGWKKKKPTFKEGVLRRKPCQQIIVVGESTNDGGGGLWHLPPPGLN